MTLSDAQCTSCISRKGLIGGHLSKNRNEFHSGTWEPPQLKKKRSRSEKAILGALGEFRGILGAALGIQEVILGMRNSSLGMAVHWVPQAPEARGDEILRFQPQEP